MKLLLVLRRLHETTNQEALLDALQDVIVNVIDSEELAILAKAADERFGAQMGLTECVPLRSGSSIFGAVLMFALLEHKAAVEPFDLELLELLSDHGGEALAASHASAEQST